MRLSFLLCFTLETSAFIPNNILYGSPISATNCPFYARFYGRISTEPQFLKKCGGTIISDRYILTAAHCTISSKGVMIDIGTVGVGSNQSLNDESQGFAVKRLIPAPKYLESGIPNPVWDIGLIELENALVFSRTVQTARWEGFKFDTTELFVIGYGVNGPNSSATELMRTSVPPLVRCDNRLCTAVDKSGRFCKGDSGGPLIKEADGMQVVVGVVSRYVTNAIEGADSYEQCEEATHNIYIDPSYFDEFITSYVGERLNYVVGRNIQDGREESVETRVETSLTWLIVLTFFVLILQ